MKSRPDEKTPGGEKPHTKKRRTGPRVPRRTSVGVNGPVALDLLYRLGSLTKSHLATFADMGKSQAQATLQGLRENKICEQRNQKTKCSSRRGRAPAHYYLSKRSGGEGILEGAAAAGIETRGKRSQKAALDRYSNFGVPSQVSHVWLRNEYFSWLVTGTREMAGTVVASPATLQGESCADFPLGQKVPGSSSSLVYPDGRFCLRLAHNRSAESARSFYVEAENSPRRAEAKRKVENYTNAWRQLIRHGSTTHGMVDAGYGPVVFVYPRGSDALSVRDYVRDRIAREQREDTSEAYLTPLRLLKEAFGRMSILYDPGQFFLFVGLDEIRELGPKDETGAINGVVYLPLYPYPLKEVMDEDGAVRLTSVLTALQRMVYPPKGGGKS